MNKKVLGLVASSILVLASTTAFAADQNMQKRIDELEEKLYQLEGKLNSTHEKATSNDNIRISLTPSPKFETVDGRYSFNINGYAQSDFAAFSKNKGRQRDAASIRAVRVMFNGTIEKNWYYKVDFDFMSAKPLKNAYVGYEGKNQASLTVGYFAQSFGLENTSSNASLTFLESSSIGALSPDAKNGVEFEAYGDNWTAALGGYAYDVNSSSNEQKYITGRLTYAPVYGNETNIHLGISGSTSFNHKNGKFTGYSEKPGTNLYTDEAYGYSKYAVTTGDIENVKGTKLVDFELAAAHNQFSIQGEYLISKVERKLVANNKFHTGYVQAAWTLTGESRNYDASSGGFVGVMPKNAFNLDEGKWGAWEIAARYNYLDLNSRTLKKGELESYTFGLNWYLNRNVRFMADYTLARTDRFSTIPNNKPRIFMLRAQVCL
jgi:phosphate-selective porin OprO/OprP